MDRESGDMRGLAALLVSVALLAPGVAPAHGKPPAATLRAAGHKQPAFNYHYRKVAADGTTCTVRGADHARTFPASRLEVNSTATDAKIVLYHRGKPAEVQMQAWRLVDDGWRAVGFGEPVATTLRWDRTIRRWTVRFHPPFPLDNYLDLVVRWPDTRRCGPSYEGAWTSSMRVLGV